VLRIKIWIIAVLLLSCWQAANSQSTLPQLQADLVSSWLVKVDGEDRTRTLRINGVEQKAADTFDLDAVYGMTDERQTKVKAEVTQLGLDRKLTLTTQADSKIVTSQVPTGAFSGTIAYKNGATQGISIEKISEDDLKATVAAALSAVPTVEKPAVDVPASCAAFSGIWTGKWGNTKTSLWVYAIDANCVAKVAYGTSARRLASAKIENGVLSFSAPLCARNGTCSFERHDDELYAAYSNIVDAWGIGRYTTVFKKKVQ